MSRARRRLSAVGVIERKTTDLASAMVELVAAERRAFTAERAYSAAQSELADASTELQDARRRVEQLQAETLRCVREVLGRTMN